MSTYTKLLLHCNGDDAAISFPDSSIYYYTVTANGNAQVDQAQYKFGNASALFDGTGDYLEIADSDDWDISSVDGTVDFWIRPNNLPANVAQLIGQANTDADGNWLIYLYSTGAMAVGRTGINELKTADSLISTGNWYHIAVVKSGSTTTIYINGVARANATTGVWNNATTYLRIGATNSTQNMYAGWIDELRVSKGIARWTSSPFDVPTEEYPNPPVTKDITTNLKKEIAASKNILSDLKTTVQESGDIGFSLLHTFDIYLNLQKEVSVYKSTLSNLLKNIPIDADVSTYLTDVFLANITSCFLLNVPKQVNVLTNLKKSISGNKTITASLKQTISSDIDVLLNLLKHWIFACDTEMTLAKEDVFDFTSDIRWKLERDTDIGFALNHTGIPVSVGLDAVDIYINGDLLTDVDNRTINWEWTMNDSPGTCEFQLARNFDNYNKTLAGVASPLVIGDTIEIYFNGVKKYHGEIIGFDTTAASERTLVRGLDRKYKVNAYLCDRDYGRHAIFNPDDDVNINQSTGSMLKYLLDNLVSYGAIVSYTGLFDGVIVEMTEAEGTPYGKLITQLLDQSGTYKWNITPAGVLEIYERGGGSIKDLPYQKSTQQIGLYDVIDCRFTINDKSELITTAEVILGAESTNSYLTYGRRVIKEYVIPDWEHADEQPGLDSAAGVASTEDEDPAAFLGFVKTESYSEIFQQYKIPSWKKGDILDENYKPNIDTSFPMLNKTWTRGTAQWVSPYIYKTETAVIIRWQPVRYCPYGFSIHSDDEGGYIRFSNSQVIITKKKFRMEKGNWEISEVISYVALSHYLRCQVWRPTEHLLAEYPTIFDVVYVGVSGAGQRRRLSFTQLGISPGYTWEEIKNGEKLIHYVPPYNDTPYAIDRAKYFLASTNDAQTNGTVVLTLDAQGYHDLNLGHRINIANTLETGIYSNNNGFPLDIESMRFSVGSYTCTLQVAHQRKHICSVDLPERSTEANIIRSIIHEA